MHVRGWVYASTYAVFVGRVTDPIIPEVRKRVPELANRNSSLTGAFDSSSSSRGTLPRD